MSDPEDPRDLLRLEEISDGLNAFGESIEAVQEELDELNFDEFLDALGGLPKEFESMNNFLDTLGVKVEESLGDVMDVFKDLKPVEDLGETIGSSKFAKGVKMFGDGLDKMKKSIGPLALFDAIFEGLSIIMEPFLPIFEIIGALFATLAAEILPVLMEAIEPLLEILMELMPVFESIGKVIGIILRIALIPLRIVFEVILAIMKPLMPLFEKLSAALSVVMERLGPLIDWLVNVFAAGIKWVVDAVTFLFKGLMEGIKWIVNGIIDIINFFIDAINLIPGVNIERIAKLQEGGIVTAPTLALLGEEYKKEAVIPLETRAGTSALGGMGGSSVQFQLDEQRDRLEGIENTLYQIYRLKKRSRRKT